MLLKKSLLIAVVVLFALQSLTLQSTSQGKLNDDFINARLIDLNAQQHRQEVAFATTEAGEPYHGCRRDRMHTGTHSVWFKVILPTDGDLSLSTDGSDYTPTADTLLSVYSGDNLATLIEVACNDDISDFNRYAGLVTTLPAGTYFIKVSNQSMQTALHASAFLVLTARFVGQYIPPTQPPPTATLTTAPTLTPTQTLSITHTQTPLPPTLTDPPLLMTALPTHTPPADFVQNGDFEDGLTGWTPKNLGSKDKLKCDKPHKLIAHQGMCSFQIKGAAGKKGKLKQALDVVSLQAGDQLTVYASVNAKRKQAPTRVILKLVYDDMTAGAKQNGKDKLTLTVAPTTGDYITVSQALSVAGKPIKGHLQLTYRADGGKARFDAIRVVKTTP